MDATALIKALMINAACQNAAAVVTNTAPPTGVVPIDPLVQDTQLQNKGVLAYEEAKIQYAALLRAFHDKSGVWPDPKVAQDAAVAGGQGGVGSSLTSYLPAVMTLLGQLPREMNLPPTIGGILDLIGKLSPAAPKPGAELAK